MTRGNAPHLYLGGPYSTPKEATQTRCLACMCEEAAMPLRGECETRLPGKPGASVSHDNEKTQEREVAPHRAPAHDEAEQLALQELERTTRAFYTVRREVSDSHGQVAHQRM